MQKRSLTEKEAAEYISMSVAFLRADRMNGVRKNRTRGPEFSKFGRTIRYMKDELDRWLDNHRVKRTASI